MNEICKIWVLEFRLRRNIFLVMPPMLVLLALLVFCSPLRPEYRELLMLALVVLLPIAGWFISTDVWLHDFRERTVGFYFELPVSSTRIYVAKYLFSLFIFAIFMLLPLIVIARWSSEDNAKALIFHLCSIFRLYSTSGSGAVGLGLMLTLLIHAMQTNWTLGFQGDKGGLAGFLLTPLALLLLWPATVWLYSPMMEIMIATDLMATLYLGFWTVIFVLSGLRLWTRGIGRGGRTGRMLAGIFGGIFAVSVAAWAIFYTVEITCYLATLKRFEHTPGIEIVRNPQRVPEAIADKRFTLKTRPEELAAANLGKTIEIPANAYFDYVHKVSYFRYLLRRATEDALKHRRYALAAALISRHLETPDIMLPQRSYLYSSNLAFPFRHRSALNSYHTPDINLLWQKIEFPTGPDALPFYRSFDAILAASKLNAEIKIILPGDKAPQPPSLTHSDLANNLPGLGISGRKRFDEVFKYVFRLSWCKSPFNGSELRNATETMKNWIEFSACLQRAKTSPADRLPGLLNELDNADFDMRYSNNPLFELVRNKYLLVPYCRLQQYALERGRCSESPEDVLLPGEAGVFQFRYCTGKPPFHRHEDSTTLRLDGSYREGNRIQSYSLCLPLVEIKKDISHERN